MFETVLGLCFFTYALPTPETEVKKDTAPDSKCCSSCENMRELLKSASTRGQHSSPKRDPLLTSIREPLWTNYEVEKFWLVLEPYMKELIGGKSHLPNPDLDYSELDPDKMSHFESCLLDIQELIWRGKYSLAVSNLRSAKGYFWNPSSERYQIRDDDGELSVLRTLFTRRIPRRKMLCQFKWNSI